MKTSQVQCSKLQAARCIPHLELRGRLAFLDDDDEEEEDDDSDLRMDPATLFDGNLVAHILSFLGDGRKEEDTPIDIDHPIQNTQKPKVGFREIGRNYARLINVSKTWRKLVQQFWVVNADFQSDSTSTWSSRRSCILWLLQNEFCLRSLALSLTVQEFPLFIKFLKGCPTGALRKCHIGFVNPLSSYAPTGRPGLRSRKQRDYCKRILDTIALECPSLEELCLLPSFWLQDQDQGQIASSVLFSMPSIKRLHLGLAQKLVGGNWTMNGDTIRHMVSNLPNLERLELTHGRGILYLPIQSRSLHFLDVTGLSRGVYVKVDCPNLERFVCAKGSGSLPLLENLAHFRFLPPPDCVGGLTLSSDFLPYIGVRVPSSCLCTIQNFHSCYASVPGGDRERFQSYLDDRSLVEQAQATVTFVEED